MTHLITGAVKKAVVPSYNLSVKGPYYPYGSDASSFFFNPYFKGAALTSSIPMVKAVAGAKTVKITLNEGDLLNKVSNIVLVLASKNTLSSVTGYSGAGVNKKTISAEGFTADVYSAFALGGTSKNITKKTTITFTFKDAVTGMSLYIIGPSLTSDTDFYWYGSDKTVLFEPKNRSLTALTIPSTTKIILSRAFKGCTRLSGNLTIPNSVTSIGEDAFYGCGFTGTLKLGSGVKTIGTSAFRDCGFTGPLTIPIGVTLVGATAFYSCDKLRGTLKIANTKIKLIGSIIGGVFAYCNGLTGSVRVYRANMTGDPFIDLPNVTVTYLG